MDNRASKLLGLGFAAGAGIVVGYLFRAGQDLWEQEQWADQAERWVKEKPDDAGAWSSLGSIQFLRGDCEGAIESKRRAIELDGSLIESYVLIAECYHILG